MSIEAGGLYRGPRAQFQGFGELAQALQQRGALQSRLAEAQNRAMEKEREQNIKNAEKVTNKYAANNLPTWGAPIYGAYEQKYAELVQNGEITANQAIGYLGGLYDQILSAEGSDFNKSKERATSYGYTTEHGSFDRAVNNADFTKKAKSQDEITSIISKKNDYTDWGFFGMNPDLRDEYINRGGWAKYWDVEEDQYGMPILVSNNGFYDSEGAQIDSDNNYLQSFALYGDLGRVYKNDDDFITVTPVSSPSKFASDLQAWNRGQFPDKQYHEAETLEYVGSQYLNLNDDIHRDARRTAFSFIQQADGEDSLLKLDEELAFIANDPSVGGGDVEDRTRRFQAAKQREDVQRHIASYAPFEGPETEEQKRSRRDRQNLQQDREESISKISDSYNIYVDAAPMDVIETVGGSVIVNDYSGQIETYAVGGLKSRQENVIRVPNKEKQQLIQAARSRGDSAVAISASYDDMPDQIEIKVEEIQVYPDIQGKEVLGLVSYDSDGSKNEIVFLERNNPEQANIDILKKLEVNIRDTYPGVTLDDFFNGNLRGSQQSTNQPASFDFNNLPGQ